MWAERASDDRWNCQSGAYDPYACVMRVLRAAWSASKAISKRFAVAAAGNSATRGEVRQCRRAVFHPGGSRRALKLAAAAASRASGADTSSRWATDLNLSLDDVILRLRVLLGHR